MPVIIAGMYSSGILTEQDMLVPNLEAPHGELVCLHLLEQVETLSVCLREGHCVCLCVRIGAGFNTILMYLHPGTFNLTSLVSFMDRWVTPDSHKSYLPVTGTTPSPPPFLKKMT